MFLEETTAGLRAYLKFSLMAQHVSVTEGRAAQVKRQATTQERLMNYSNFSCFLLLHTTRTLSFSLSSSFTKLADGNSLVNTVVTSVLRPLLETDSPDQNIS
jgi:hypothetical protein